MFEFVQDGSPFIVLVVIPLLIMVARIIDVSFSTLRIVYLMKGEKMFAAGLGFFESLIWLIAISQIIQNVTNIPAYIGWAAGFALGNYFGLIIEERLAVGKLIIRVITAADAQLLVDQLKNAGFGVTHIDGQGTAGKVKLIFCVIQRDQYERIVGIIHEFNPKAFYTVEDVRSAREGVFPPSRGVYQRMGLIPIFARQPKKK
jgi:uncharacterized protein YebE (UPF0316 family)